MQHTTFSVNHDFGLVKNGKVQKRGRINLIGRMSPFTVCVFLISDLLILVTSK